MKNTIKRILLFLLAIPGLFAMILFLPHYHHLSVSILLILCSILGTYEICRMMNHFGFEVDTKLFPLLGGVLPLGAYLQVVGVIPQGYEALLLCFLLIAGFIFPVFQNSKKEMGQAFRQLMAYLTAGLYPGFFVSYIVKFAQFEHPTRIYIIFMFLVFLNDSSAWLFGKLFGRKRNVLVASPNKSLAGFAGGLFASVLVMVISRLLFQDTFNTSYISVISAGILFGFTTILGDLVESAIKRSVGVKDSGNIIMGRGGMLDSIDSLLITAPVYYYFLLAIS